MGKFKDRKPLPKAYRLKKKIGKIKKPEVKTEHPSTRIVVRNIPFKATERDIRNLFSPFGEINEINLLKRPDGSLVGCGFVQFKTEEDASKAIFQTNKKEFMGRNIQCSWAIPKSKYYEKLESEKDENADNSKSKDTKRISAGNVNKTKDTDAQKHDETIDISNEKDETQETDETTSERKKSKKQKVVKKLTSEERKAQKLKKQKKRARIVVRNLPFKATEENIREFFSCYGTIEDIQLPTKPDGKKVGCCFIQFEKVNCAAKAIHYANLKEFLDRNIVVDWALAKKTFESKIKTKLSKDGIKTESEDSVEIKEEPQSEDESMKSDDDSHDNHSDDDREDSLLKSENSSDEDDEEEEEEKYNAADNEDINEEEEDVKFDPKSSKPRRFSNDINEEKTVFLKNVPFRATNDDLKQCMEQFGPVYYALICIDKLTEHSKGTAFVKFRNTEDAKKCLEAGTELQLLGQVLDPHPALSRNDLNNKSSDRKQKAKDSRNLYLIREGVVLAGSPASQNVSAADMAKRLKIEQWKSQILKNLNMFVSKVRIVIHNLPPTLTDSGLRDIVRKYAPRDAIITETRIMKNDRGVGTSKEYGFVSFTKHEDALHTLRMINNNPNIFSAHRRPIVSFSIENKIMVNAKQNRLVKSRKNNPLSCEYVPPKKDDDKNEPKNSKDKISGIKNNQQKNKRKNSRGSKTTISSPGNKRKFQQKDSVKTNGPPTKKRKVFKKKT